MDKERQLIRRREREQARKKQDRQDRLMIEYIKVKYPVQYEEAREYYNSLNKQYSNVHDLRKTWRFKDFKASTKTTDNMKLEIPLVKIPKEPKEIHEATNIKETISEGNGQKIDDIFPDIDMNDLVSEIPQHLIDDIIQELRADPNLTEMMSTVEDQVDSYIDNDIDIDIEISDDLLEKELMW